MVVEVPYLSIVIPFFNEQECLEELLSRIKKAVAPLVQPVELILVDDGSKDGSNKVISDFQKNNDMNIKLLILGKNLGHMKALEIGMNQSSGSYVLTMDADGQDPPELIPILLSKIQEKKYDVLQTKRPNRQIDGFFKRSSASYFYKIMGKLIDNPDISHAADFRILTRESVNLLLEQRNQKKVFRFLIHAVGLNIGYYEFERPNRIKGETKYSLSKMLKLALDSVLSFSSKPLRIIVAIGFWSSTIFALATSVVVFLKFNYQLVPGWASLVTLYLLVNSIVITLIGVVGLYIAEVFDQNKTIHVKIEEFNFKKNT